jgi:hypothetical protein
VIVLADAELPSFGRQGHVVRRAVQDRMKLSKKPRNQPEEWTMQGMMDEMIGGGMMWGMGLFWLLTLSVLVLAAGALIKYLFFSGGRD